MATKIRLMRLGKIRAPYYRIVVADSRTKREGRVIETIGKYHPKEDPSVIQIDGERAQYWLSVGAQPTEPVAALLRKTGDWQKFKGEPAPPPLLVAAPKADKKVVFEAAAKQSIADAEADAKPKKAAAAKPKKAAEAIADTPEGAVTDAAATEVLAEAASAAATEAPASETPADAAPAAEATPDAPVEAPVADAPEAEVTEPAATEALTEAAEAATTDAAADDADTTKPAAE